MKILSETKALVKLNDLKNNFQTHIRENYEQKAKDCVTCETKGICCTDAHFVNVHITKLEAAAIGEALGKLSAEKQAEIYERAAGTVEKYNLKSSGDTFAQTFACPLFEKGVGCLVHFEGKPAPCISHACYENKEDLPPEFLQEAIEHKIERLNKRTYGKSCTWLPLPVWLNLINPFKKYK